ncbi:MAG: DNA polymerase III subunit gamma/tau [Alphaproteobacteria bacterium]|nr:DNA polymerase III subunit gamma/tau [Alphaproteobacteria bacterium]
MAKKSADATTTAPAAKPAEYRVLARKYRPQNFAELKGQDALVRTLTNAIESGRIAHAFMLTGVRGVGKTTTARIVARALNCEQGPTINPCGVCEQCRAIAEDRHVDVLEMDAASRTGVDDIREIIDSVQYAPVSGRYKVFIIDEVHMLSKAAFNALLKTLEEPPENVKFVFATTEIRKVPVTVLSRCQRFDLRRIGADVLENYFMEITGKENVEAEPSAIALIARAADGSARDGLSLLDQAISREQGKVTEDQVRSMLGLVDRSVTLDLFEALQKGQSGETMGYLDALYKGGADPIMVLQDLLELTHYLTKVKVSPEMARDQALPEAERVRGAALAKTLSVPVLTRTWQMLTKGISEVQQAFNAQQALEMVLIRLLFAAELPTPGDLIKQVKDGTATGMAGQLGGGMGGGSPRGTAMQNTSAVSAARMAAPEPQQVLQAQAVLNSFEDVAALFGQRREALLQNTIETHVHPVKFAQGHLEVRLTEDAPRALVGQMAQKLTEWTGQRWVVSLSREEGASTIASRKQAQMQNLRAEVEASPIVAAVLTAFPGAKITEIKNKTDAE